MKRMLKWLSHPSRTIKATTGANVSRWACLLAMTAPSVAAITLTLTNYETATEAKLAFALAAVLTALSIAPMVMQASKDIEA